MVHVCSLVGLPTPQGQYDSSGKEPSEQDGRKVGLELVYRIG